ncbi:MAG: aldehyde ferredoxin oxidoreductase N-terminal domain-containing protein, partial [Promethearchaeota archaeon]
MSNNTNLKDYFGFIGKILKIDLTSQKIRTEKLDLRIARNFFGGAGYACRYLIEKINFNTEPLSKDNIAMIMTGPFCLTSAPSFGRFAICAKSPYTGLWGESNCGGYFGPELKKAGYDGIIITGKSEIPVFLKIKNENVEIINATTYWGKNIKETQFRLGNIEEDVKFRVLCIGPAGEKLVKFSTINTDGRSAGRTGMGAVLGSKKLKAIIVHGDKYKPKIAEEIEFKKIVKKMIKVILESQATKALRGFGTSFGVMTSHSFGDLPIKYWTKGEWDKVHNISGEQLKENLLIKNKSCYGCSIGCGRIIEIEGKKSLFSNCEGPEYETIAGFGSMILNDNLKSIAIANNLCNNYGLDTISTSGTIALLYFLYNR